MTRIAHTLALSVAALALLAVLPALGGCKPPNAGPRAVAGGGGSGSGAAPVRRAAPAEKPELNDALFAALSECDEDRAIELVNQGASVNARNANNIPILFLASAGVIGCDAVFPELTRVLLEYGADVNATVGDNGIQAIHFVGRAGASDRPGIRETLDLLLRYGADINAKTADGRPPIYYASQLGNEEWTQYLISRGAQPQ